VHHRLFAFVGQKVENERAVNQNEVFLAHPDFSIAEF
jgi:hypothetical protein